MTTEMNPGGPIRPDVIRFLDTLGIIGWKNNKAVMCGRCELDMLTELSVRQVEGEDVAPSYFGRIIRLRRDFDSAFEKASRTARLIVNDRSEMQVGELEGFPLQHYRNRSDELLRFLEEIPRLLPVLEREFYEYVTYRRISGKLLPAYVDRLQAVSKGDEQVEKWLEGNLSNLYRSDIPFMETDIAFRTLDAYYRETNRRLIAAAYYREHVPDMLRVLRRSVSVLGKVISDDRSSGPSLGHADQVEAVRSEAEISIAEIVKRRSSEADDERTHDEIVGLMERINALYEKFRK
ncbi:MAG: hypothetical protein HGA31_05980 [Candidatus Moranbacteria bacterium]|nr:hypothetical protein [Candidatus Moranbacteria bacterium]